MRNGRDNKCALLLKNDSETLRNDNIILLDFFFLDTLFGGVVRPEINRRRVRPYCSAGADKSKNNNSLAVSSRPRIRCIVALLSTRVYPFYAQ